ncbi:MAG: hypothetical protein HQK54_07085 [Oligoflexales bacterium]|nr:hypothetical protein [Oligoflexales bacterium]
MYILHLLLLLIIALDSTEASAGLLAGIGGRWQNFSLRPRDTEATPNYYGYGVDVDLGYSFSHLFDISIYGDYVPAQRNTATLGKEMVQFREYGGKFGFRIGGNIYVALRGGVFVYRLLFRSNDQEQDGEWMGNGGALSIGAFQRRQREHFLHIAFDLGSANLSRYDEVDEKKRIIDIVGVSLKYTFIVFDGFKVGSLFGGGFFKSLDM